MASTVGSAADRNARRSCCRRTTASDLELRRTEWRTDHLEREVVGRFADAVEAGDVDAMVPLLTDDAWLTMPRERTNIRAAARSARSRRGREVARGELRLVQAARLASPHARVTFRLPN
jgi:hypothetical protein